MTQFHHRKLPDYSTLLSGRAPPDEVGFPSSQLQIWYNSTNESWVGDGERPHKHLRSDECFIVLRGSLTVEVDGRHYTMRVGVGIIITNEGKHYITLWLEGDYAGGEPTVNAAYEMAEVGWFAWDALPQPLFLSLQQLLDGAHYPPENVRPGSRNKLAVYALSFGFGRRANVNHTRLRKVSLRQIV